MKHTLVILAIAMIPTCLYAVDGQVLINQATVIAAGGFPYKITQPGSYKLSGNLIVPDANTTAIWIKADSVTLDLNGFSILGPVDCSGGFTPFCAGHGGNQPGSNGSGMGITDSIDELPQDSPPHVNITIRNGTIQGMGSYGILLFGESNLVEYMHVRSNGSHGIGLFGGFFRSHNTIVQHNNVQFNSRSGISVDGGLVTDNTVSENNLDGITVFGPGSVARNVSVNNGIYGIDGLNVGVNYIGNVLLDNGSAPTSGGAINQGQNLCGAAACPGATP